MIDIGRSRELCLLQSLVFSIYIVKLAEQHTTFESIIKAEPLTSLVVETAQNIRASQSFFVWIFPNEICAYDMIMPYSVSICTQLGLLSCEV